MRKWGRWRRGWVNEWADGDWRNTWRCTIPFPHFSIGRSDDGIPHTVLFVWFCLGVIWTRYYEEVA